MTFDAVSATAVIRNTATIRTHLILTMRLPSAG
jgi:hypothetical protein